MTTESTNSPLNFSTAAAVRVKELLKEEDNDSLMLRVYISGGGCSGFQYGFTYDEEVGDGDTVVENEGVKLLVDPMSFQYLAGSEIDFSDDPFNQHFIIRNPNSTGTCGCGSSFSA